MIGQEKLLNKIKSYDIDTFPRSLILYGKHGSGKHSLCSEVARSLRLKVASLDDSLYKSTIDEIYANPEPYLYTINGDDISIREENVILKFLEEPLKNSFIIITCSNKNKLLATILNRCQIWELEQYSEDELMTFYNDCNNDCNHSEHQKELVFKIANTPGKMKRYNNQPAVEIYNLCNLILEKVKTANFPNSLSIVNKVDFDHEDITKYEDSFFIEMLLMCAKDRVVNNISEDAVKQYILTDKLFNDYDISNLNKKQLFEHYLCELKLL